jgi:hypothetical protein
MSALVRGLVNWAKPVVSWVKPAVQLPSMNNLFQQTARGMANHRHKKVIKEAKGFRGRANRVFTVALHRVTKARQYAYRDRKVLFCFSIFVVCVVSLQFLFALFCSGEKERFQSIVDSTN